VTSVTGSTTTISPERVEIQPPKEQYKGQNVPRKEDKRLVQGQGTFVDDIKRHHMGYIHFVRSPYAHAHITSIDVSKAESMKGVYGTLTGEEVASLTDPFFQLSSVPGGNIKDYALALGKVRFVGEAIVAVVAETRELARDASELVEIEYTHWRSRSRSSTTTPAATSCGPACTSGATSTRRSPRPTRS
jgi:CO/xanthine dehydrogenase Mo-binding subunit